MKRIEHLKEHRSTFLLIRTDRLGDVILSTPVARVLRQHFPAMRIHFLVRKYTLPVVTDHPFVNRAWIDEDFAIFRSKVDFLH
ncbi:MAG TPA: hypothetical protein ENH29_09715, partial [Bacteroidetes bacterium]|nr:hypothetical protein [Bacteroidota bacterium]